MELRKLVPGDEARADAFLARHADASMFLRSNLRDSGLVDSGRPREATWFAALEDERIVGIAAHGWNGVVIVQAPVAPGELACAAVDGTRSRGRGVTGLVGPRDQIVAARAALGLATRRATLDDRELLYALDLDALRIPAALTSGALCARRTTLADVDQCARWREDYCVETLGMSRGAPLTQRARADVELLHARGDAFVVTSDRGELLAYSGFNAKLPDIVQIGGVWTPLAQRGRGLAKAVVAGSLTIARAEGARRAVLFTGEENVPARRAYESLGFDAIGELGLVYFAD